MQRVIDHVMKAVRHEQVLPVPCAFWNLAPWTASMAGVRCIDYYKNVETKLAVQEGIQRLFPEAVLFPGLFPDQAVVAEAHILGCDIIWLENDAPYARAFIQDPAEIDRITLGHVESHPMVRTIVSEYEYMWRHADRALLHEYGHLDGVAFVMGPMEIAAMAMGYDKLFYAFYDEPERVHRLMEIITELVCRLLRMYEGVNGRLKRLCLADHMPTQLPPSLFIEYFKPYFKRIYEEFSYPEIRLWHNEGKSSHVFDELLDVNFNVFNFGADDLALAKEKLGDRICLMGNLNSVNLVRSGSPEQVRAAVHQRVRQGYKNGGYLVSGGGGLSENTPVENVRAIIEEARLFAGE